MQERRKNSGPKIGSTPVANGDHFNPAHLPASSEPASASPLGEDDLGQRSAAFSSLSSEGRATKTKAGKPCLHPLQQSKSIKIAAPRADNSLEDLSGTAEQLRDDPSSSLGELGREKIGAPSEILKFLLAKNCVQI